jgi:succinoglycan biosynthesis protein ExoM
MTDQPLVSHPHPAPQRADPVKVAVGIITFRRPEGLAALLEGLGSLRFQRTAAPDLVFVVVDNDPAGSAQRVCETAAGALSGPLRYVVEPRRGLSFARNRAVAAAISEGADHLAFIDDDEVPTPGWLDELLRIAGEHRADVVAGRVVRHFERDPPDWLSRGGFFLDPDLSTGTRVRTASTSNVLASKQVLTDLGPPFDERFALTKGEDTHFFLRVSSAGYRLVWANDAVVEERVPAERMQLGWILRRSYRVANTWSVCERELSPSPGLLGLRAVKAIARLMLGTGLLVAGAVAGRDVAVRGLWHLAYGAGNLTGLLGLRFDEVRGGRR